MRTALGIAYPGKDLPFDWSTADVLAEAWPNPDFFKGYLLPDGHVCVVVPLAPGRFRVIASSADALAALPVPISVTETKHSGTFRISVGRPRIIGRAGCFWPKTRLIAIRPSVVAA